MAYIEFDEGQEPINPEPPKSKRIILIVALVAIVAVVAIAIFALSGDEEPQWTDCTGEPLPYFTEGEYHYSGTYWDYIRGELEGKAPLYSYGWKIESLPILSLFESELYKAEYKATQKRTGPVYTSPDGTEWDTTVYRIVYFEVTFAGNLMVHMERHDEYVQMDFTMDGWAKA